MDDISDVQSSVDSVDNDDVTVDDTDGGITLLEENLYRKSGFIQNTGSASMRVTTDGSAPTDTHGKLVLSGGSLTMSSPFCPGNSVKAKCSEGESTTANASEVS